MSIATGRTRGDARVQSLPSRVRAWELWSITRQGLAFIAVIELLVVAATIASLVGTHPTTADATRAAVLAALSIAYAEVADRIERVRRFLHAGGMFHVRSNPSSVWTFAGALVLPAGCAAAVVILIYAHMLLLGRRHKTLRPYRVVFGCAAALTGTLAAVQVHRWRSTGLLDGGAATAATTAAALVVYTGVSLVVALTASYLLADGASLRALLPDGSDFAFEGATLVLGLVTAELVFHLTWATPAIYLLVVMLHRSTMVAQLEAAARTDGRTGLLNATAWQQLAASLLQRAEREGRPAAVVLIDLDRFKAVNDTYGHQVGDLVLRAVADCLKHELRGYDAVGRYGGEEFVAYLDDVDASAALAIAERARQAVRALRTDAASTVTASLGVAVYPLDGADVSGLVHAADTALYAAKRAGRDRVATLDESHARQESRPA